MASEQPAPAKKSVNVTRIVLLFILGVALVGLAFDQYGRYQMSQAYDRTEEVTGDVEKQQIRTLMGVEPSHVSTDGNLEHYDFPGVFNTYRVIVTYREMGAGKYAFDAEKLSIFRFGAQ